MKKLILCVVSVFLLIPSVLRASEETLAVAEPVGRSGVTKEEMETLWGILESCVRSEQYTLVSRSALKQIMTEIGFTGDSGLAEADSLQKADPGKLKTVKYLLITEVGKFGSGYNCTLRILDSSTGGINQARTANLRVNSLDELADRIEPALRELLSDEKRSPFAALLSPDTRLAPTPGYFASGLNTEIESGMLKEGVRLQNLQNIAKILKDNHLDALYELEPKMFVKVGKLLEVRYLIQTAVTRFSVDAIPYSVEESGARGIRFIGNFEGAVRMVSAETGEVAAVLPFEEKIDFRKLDRSETRDWAPEDYGKYLIRKTVSEKILPGLLIKTAGLIHAK